MLMLSACGGGGGNNGEEILETTTETNTQTPTETTIEIVAENPEFIQGNSATDDALKATISIDGGTPVPLTIGLINTSSTSIKLSKERHSMAITFTHTNPLNKRTVILATATKEFDLSNGADTLSFAVSDYEIDRHDDDGDGFSNLAEIKSNTDPTDDSSLPTRSCTLDDSTSLIGSCTLG